VPTAVNFDPRSRAFLEARLRSDFEGLGLDELSLCLPDGTEVAKLRRQAHANFAGRLSSQLNLSLEEPPSGIDPKNYRYYQAPEPMRGPARGSLSATVFEENYFTLDRRQRLEDTLDSLLPYLRFKAEYRDFFYWLDSEIAELVRSRARMRKESWTGIYLLAREHLELGPFRGFKTQHHVIPLERGLCGQAARTGETVVADDVRSASHYLACSPLTRSEIVVALKDSSGQIWGELDLDSPQVSAYDNCERAELEEWCESLSRKAERAKIFKQK
jgi:GAF domain-containing protein